MSEFERVRQIGIDRNLDEMLREIAFTCIVEVNWKADRKMGPLVLPYHRHSRERMGEPLEDRGATESQFEQKFKFPSLLDALSFCRDSRPVLEADFTPFTLGIYWRLLGKSD
jgi:hypothetical protein